ncbi:acyl carrier protein [Aerococcaceae bacterium NML191292]|nr:acyl carrier protein [Aerococcaceae bacterium NML210727]MCW6655330.1 acyl carrier protein [Aerococcaceae bacterium NML201296]MCW6660451.1 acyl carrier protein [Aerococcaceae bacterium NML191292]MCW6661979.1 acyl carrier protein [Aerococcaceae bacterium NML201209]MCW6663252.1 acyl carrier protein [Aerococcaceae bacterium NML190073]MCW6665385.1 acyl carrier protein [Aerococcaceae bacterium NML191219]MCW6675642.1 acyl carrier protein [Aerococcaceae bacterium NML171108]MCW6677224.1 acyl carri
MVFEKVQTIIANQLGVDAETITPATDFENDLKADSLDVFQIISEIEDELDITIDTDQNLKTVQDLVNYIESL